MIRTVPIPKTVSRMGCAPGAGCCDSCGGHGHTLEGTRTNRIFTPGEGVRNMALHSHLGETQCDSDGNCYTDGVLTSAPLTTGPGCPPGVPTCGSSSAGISPTALYIGVGLLAVLLLEATSRRR